MTYSLFPLVTRGDLWSAADHNTYLRANLEETEPAKVTTAGDVIYATGAGVIDRLPLTEGRILAAGDSAPYWLEIGDPFAKLRSKYQPSDGVEWTTFPPGEICTRTTAQSIPNNTTTEIVFDTANINLFSMWSVGQPHKIMNPLPFTWYFCISAYLYFQSPNTSIHQINFIRYDSTGTGTGIGPGKTAIAGATGKNFRMSYSFITTLAQGDQVTMPVMQKSGGAMNVYYAKMSVVALL